ncbi:MAG: TonB-dependent receptor plug domain-containing protein [Gammaproteobacteria bacterium]|nr:TonB-dependent receptor plug domain-containing protein [Gammaproteobacteria bacterium]
MRLSLAFLGACAGMFAASTGVQPASAQQVAADLPTLDEVLVTARKRQETLQEVPVAVTAFDAQDIADRQIRSIEDIARFTPGFVFSKAFGRATERPVVRGQSNILAGTNISAEAGAAYFVDGVYYPGDIQSLNLDDVARIEVIKGPQSALYGRNTYSGAINFVTRGPGEEFGARLGGHFDEDEYEATLSLGGPITDTLAAQVALRKLEFDGQWRNTVTGNTIGGEATDSVSLVVDFEPTEQLSFRLRGSYSEDRDGTRPLFLQSAAFNNCLPGVRSLASYPASGSTNRNQYFCGDVQAQPIALNDGPRQQLNPLPGVPANVTIFGASAYNAAQGAAFSGVERDLTLISLIGDWDIGNSGYSLTVQSAWRDEDRRTGSDSDHSSVNYIAAAPPGTQGTCFLCASDLDL